MWNIFSLFGQKKKDERQSCERLHGKRGKIVRLPKSPWDLNEGYGALMRELAKR